MYNREWYRAGSGGDSVDDKRSCGMGWDRGQGRGRAAERRQSVSQLVNGEKKKEWERQREQARESVTASNTHYVGSVCCCWLCLPACWFWLYDCESAKPAKPAPPWRSSRVFQRRRRRIACWELEAFGHTFIHVASKIRFLNTHPHLTEKKKNKPYSTVLNIIKGYTQFIVCNCCDIIAWNNI